VTHLGERITPLVDGQLPADAAERASIHLAACRPCRDAVAAERLMKSRLATLGSPQPGEDLVRRLLHLAGPDGPLPPRVGHVPGTPRPRPISGPSRSTRPVSGPPLARTGSRRPAVAAGVSRAVAGHRPGVSGRLSRVSRVRVTAAVVGAMCLVGAGVASGVVSAGAAGQPGVVPPVDTLVVQHSTSTGSLTFGDQNAEWETGDTAGSGR
jgi:anti-sigma factor RsiW